MTQFSVTSCKRGLILVLALQYCPHFFFHEHLKYVSTNYPEVKFIIGQGRQGQLYTQCLAVVSHSHLSSDGWRENEERLYQLYLQPILFSELLILTSTWNLLQAALELLVLLTAFTSAH